MVVETLRHLLVDLERHLLTTLLAGRAADPSADLAAVSGRTVADTIYAIDRITDDALVAWFERSWPVAETGTVELVAESLDEPVVIGAGAPSWTCIVDTIDGTRGLMYDKRSAWILAAVAPAGATLAGVVAAAMTEVPTTKQWASDRYSAVRGGGVEGSRTNVLDGGGGEVALAPRPSQAHDLDHGWSSFARFFPQGKALVARFEERVWELVTGSTPVASDLAVFDDQYLSTGGQFAELLAGHDRVLGDVRPLAFTTLGLDAALSCHPYDACCSLVLEEAGCVVLDPWGRPLDVPLDTTTPVAWVGFANQALAELVLPAVTAAASEVFSTARPS